MPYWRGQRGQMRRRGCSQRSSSSTAWCPCLRSTARCSWEGGWPTVDHETHPDSITTPSLAEKEQETEGRIKSTVSARTERAENDGKSFLMKTNSQQQFQVSPWQGPWGWYPSSTELRDKKSIQAYMRGRGGVCGRYLTLDRFGVLLDLTMGGAADHIPHYDLPRGVSWGQPQTVGRALVVVVVLPGPFHLQNTRGNIQ